MNQLTKHTQFEIPKTLDQIDELLEHSRETYRILNLAQAELRSEILLLGREKAKLQGIMFPPSFDTILHPHNRRQVA